LPELKLTDDEAKQLLYVANGKVRACDWLLQDETRVRTFNREDKQTALNRIKERKAFWLNLVSQLKGQIPEEKEVERVKKLQEKKV
jgi:hypothetical protein